MVTPTAMEVFGMAYGIALLIWQAIACWYMIVDGNDFAVASMRSLLVSAFIGPPVGWLVACWYEGRKALESGDSQRDGRIR